MWGESEFMGERYVAIVDDNEEDRYQIESLFPINWLKRCMSFEDEDVFLEALQNDDDAVPALVFLDVRMRSSESGFDVLKWLRNEPRFRALPVIMISASDSVFDVNEAYELGANLFIHKSDEPREFSKRVKDLLKTMTTVGRFPTLED